MGTAPRAALQQLLGAHSAEGHGKGTRMHCPRAGGAASGINRGVEGSGRIQLQGLEGSSRAQV